jgi:hypothetical protein
MLTLVLDASFFRYVEGDFSFGRHFADRTKLAMTLLPPKENPYLSYILLGHHYSEDHLPTYLLAKNLGRLVTGQRLVHRRRELGEHVDRDGATVGRGAPVGSRPAPLLTCAGHTSARGRSLRGPEPELVAGRG